MSHHDSDHSEQQTRAPMGPTGRKLRTAMFVCLGLLVVLNLLILPHHPHFGLEKVPGFWAAFGLIGAVLLAKLAKGAAHTFLGKPEDYYQQDK